MSFFSKFAVKQEPIYDTTEPYPDDDAAVDDEDDAQQSSATTSRTTVSAAYYDDDASASTAAKRPRLGPSAQRSIVGESSIQNVVLRPTNRSVATIPVATLMPHQQRPLSLDDYDEPPQLVAMASRHSRAATHESSHSAANMVNFVVARHEAGGLPVDPNASAGGGDRYMNTMLRRCLTAPPGRWMPCSQTQFVDPRISSTATSFDHFLEWCATARPNEPACARGVDCVAFTIQNENGERINNAPFVATWHKDDMLNNPDEAASNWKKRLCVCCDMYIALRVYVNSHTTNSGVDPSYPTKTTASGAVERVKLALDWHVLFNLTDQFCQDETIGPDNQCFNGLTGNVPRLHLTGWSAVSTIETNRKKFLPPYTRYVAPIDAPTRDGTRGF